MSEKREGSEPPNRPALSSRELLQETTRTTKVTAERIVAFLTAPSSRSLVRTGVIILAVFTFDLILPLGITAAGLYMAAVLSAVPIPHRRAVVATAAICSVLVLADWCFGAANGAVEIWYVVINRLISLGVIWSTALMAGAWIEIQRRQAEQLQENRLLHQAMSLSAITESFDEALGSCMQVICEITMWPIGHVYHYDGRSKRLVPSDIWTIPDGDEFTRFRRQTMETHFGKGEGVPGRIWAAGEPLWISKIEDPRIDQTDEDSPLVQGAFGFPIIVDGEPLAVIEFFASSDAAPDPQLLLLAGSAGDQLSRVAERRLWSEERARTAAIVDSSYDAIIGKDLNDRIISWNNGAEVVYGFSEEEAIGQSIALILPDGMNEEEPTIADAIRRGRRLSQFETTRRRKDGSLIDVAVTVSPILDSRARVIGSSTIERNITLRKRREQELETAQRAAEAANRAKNEFLANVSHELRTPMNAVLGMLNLALDEELETDTRDYLETARDSAQTLLYLLNDLLDFSRMEAGRFELDRDPFDLRSTMDGAVRAMSVYASEKGLELTCHVGRDVPNQLLGDAHRLRQVVINLVGNAVKFTEEGEIAIRVSAGALDANRVELQLAVSDTGSGISAEDQERIFAPFTQADSSTTRQKAGVGLGLAICNELVRKMGGRIRLESEVGRGSTFHCTMWFDVLEDEDTSEVVPELANLPVLVADDNPTNLRILSEALSAWSMKPVAVDCGQAALECVRRQEAAGQQFPLILVDAVMPDIDGFTLIETLQQRAQEQNGSQTILMVNATDRKIVRERAADLDIAAVLEKPVTQSKLLDAVMTALQGPPLEREFDSRIRTAQRSLRVLVVEDTPANQKVIRAILEKRGHEVHLANNGREGVDAVAGGRYDVVVMDVQMPTMDGLQATRAIRQLTSKTDRSVPIVAMTAHARREDRDKCIAAGMDAYISKPIDAEELIKLVETVHRTPLPVEDGFTASSDSPKSPGGSADRAAPVINMDAARARMGGDDALLADMAVMFLEDAPKLLGELAEAMRAEDSETVQRAAHSLKGLASTFSAAHAVEAAAEMEAASHDSNHTSRDRLYSALQESIEQVAEALKASLPLENVPTDE